MPSVGDNFVFRVKDFQTYDFQQCLNVYYFRQVGGAFAENAAAVAQAYIDQVLPTVLSLQSSFVVHDRIECEQLNSLTNFAAIPLTDVEGDLVGSPLPPFLASGFRLIRETKETRNGYKRYVGLTEDVVEGRAYATSFDVDLAAHAAVLDNGLLTGSFTLATVIVGGMYDTTVEPKELKPQADWIWNTVLSVEVQPNVTSQNTRKIGRGV